MSDPWLCRDGYTVTVTGEIRRFFFLFYCAAAGKIYLNESEGGSPVKSL